MPPARIHIIDSEMAKLEKPDMCRSSSCLYPKRLRVCSSSERFGGGAPSGLPAGGTFGGSSDGTTGALHIGQRAAAQEFSGGSPLSIRATVPKLLVLDFKQNIT